ncbi:MAG: DUF4349 domain-containing protein, partial [Clostridia bacterium]|nr:DUF4349 domain-containing protein [Clostridia bacterium]
MHNYDENEVLRDMLSGLNDEVPPMPEELHTAWMQKVEEHMEDHRAANTRSRKAFTHFLSAAAALVFIVGGTLLTRDDLENRARLEKDYAITAASNDQLAYAAKNAAEYRQALADYENAVNGAAANDAGVTAAIYTAASGASYDSVPAPASAEAETGTFTAYGKRSAEAEDAITEESAAETVSTIGEKKIIRTATLTLQTQTYDGSLASLKTMCEAEGGWIENSSESLNSSTGLRRAYLTLRIPQDALDGYIAGTQELGRITSRSETATDVT